MENDCLCFSCCQNRNFDKINFLKKSKSTAIKGRIRTKRTRFGILLPSNGAFDRVPDEVLVHIFNYLPPINLDNFFALIALEMVSTRIRTIVTKNNKIWKNVTELVLGFHPDLPKSQYLCHIGHFTLNLFLRRVQKITKVIINLKSEKTNCQWLCVKMIQSKIYPVLDRYLVKIDMRELIIHKNLQNGTEELLVKELIENGGRGSLERLHINKENFSHRITSLFSDCTSLKNVKLSNIDYSVEIPDSQRFFRSLRQFRFVEVLEISGYSERCTGEVYIYIIMSLNVQPFRLHTIRFTNPYFRVPCTRISLMVLPYFFTQNHLSLGELEIHCCPVISDFNDLPQLFDALTRPTHLHLVLCACLDLRVCKHLHLLAELLKNASQKNVDDMKITLTFNYFDGYRWLRMPAVCNLLKSFDVPYEYEPEDGDVWTFIRGKLNVTLKLKIVEDKKRNLEKIDFLKRSKIDLSQALESLRITNSDIQTSNGGLNQLSNEVLLRIFNNIPPINMNNFLTLIALEMVSKRIRSFAIKNKKIWENATELVIGFHPDLPFDQYLCHIGHFTLTLFLSRVKKITKVIINLQSDKLGCDWSCEKMIGSKVYPVLDCYSEKTADICQLTVHKIYRNTVEEFLVQKLINNGSKESLETVHINNRQKKFSDALGIILVKCPSLKYLKLSCNGRTVPYRTVSEFLEHKLLQVLEISGYTEMCVFYGLLAERNSFHPFASIRFSNPNRLSSLAQLHRITFNRSSIRQLEIHYCAAINKISYLRNILNGAPDSTHLKMTFFPCLKLTSVTRLTAFLKNAQQENVDDLKISFTFKHSDINREDRLSIVHSLLGPFDVPCIPEHEDVWMFIRGKLTVTLKLEKFEDASLICHPTVL